MTESERQKRQRAFRHGLWAERFAATYLIAKGYYILGIRTQTPLGEIDLIVRRCNIIGFIEVKARANKEDAMEAVTLHKRKRIVQAAKAWLAAHPHYMYQILRFDVICIMPWRLPHHITGAFMEDGMT